MSVSTAGMCPGESLSVSRALNVIVIPGRSPLKCLVPPIEIAGMAVVVALSPGADIVVEAPIVIGGIGNFMYTSTAYSKSPISAFCHFSFRKQRS